MTRVIVSLNRLDGLDGNTFEAERVESHTARALQLAKSVQLGLDCVECASCCGADDATLYTYFVASCSRYCYLILVRKNCFSVRIADPVYAASVQTEKLANDHTRRFLDRTATQQ